MAELQGKGAGPVTLDEKVHDEDMGHGQYGLQLVHPYCPLGPARGPGQGLAKACFNVHPGHAGYRQEHEADDEDRVHPLS